MSSGYLLRWRSTLDSAWRLYLKILDSGFPPKEFVFDFFKEDGFCRQVPNSQMVFDEITKRGLRPSVVNFNALINWYCRRGKREEGLRLKKVMEESWRCTPDVYAYSALISRLCMLVSKTGF